MVKIKRKPLPASLIVTQANELVSARYTLPLAEQRLILTMIAKIQPDDEDFKPYRIGISELAEFMGIDKNSAYRECKKTTKNLLSRVLEIQEPGRLLQTHWVSSADYINGSGMVMLCFDPQLKPYLLKLKGNFTSSKLEMLLSFKSQYTMRVYNLLKQYERLKEREIELDILREILGLRKDQHTLYGHLKTNILIPVQKELAHKADIFFEFSEVKYGRRVGAIKFRIFTKKMVEPIENTKSSDLDHLLPNNNVDLLSSDRLLQFIPEVHRAKKTVQSAVIEFDKKHGFEYVKRNILYSNAKADKSYAGFLNNSLKSDWGHDWELDKKLPVNIEKNTCSKEPWELKGFGSKKEYEETMWRKQMAQYGHIVQ